jgi:hypothetical protein
MLHIIFELPNSTKTDPSTPGLVTKPNVNLGMGNTALTIEILLVIAVGIASLDFVYSRIDVQLESIFDLFNNLHRPLKLSVETSYAYFKRNMR